MLRDELCALCLALLAGPALGSTLGLLVLKLGWSAGPGWGREAKESSRFGGDRKCGIKSRAWRKSLRSKTMRFKTDTVWKLLLACQTTGTKNKAKNPHTKCVFRSCGSHGFKASSCEDSGVACFIRNVISCHFDAHNV